MELTDPSRPDLIKALEHITTEVAHLQALLAREGATTLRHVLTSIELQTGEAAAAAYPQGMKYLVDGHPGVGHLPEAKGFGERPYNELRLAAVAAHAKRVRNLVAYRKTHSGRELAQPDPKAHGTAPRSRWSAPPVGSQTLWWPKDGSRPTRS